MKMRGTGGTGSVRCWLLNYRKRRGTGTYRRKKWRGHFDEVFAEISGVTHWLWCHGDHEREVLESVNASVRARKSEQTWLKKP